MVQFSAKSPSHFGVPEIGRFRLKIGENMFVSFFLFLVGFYFFCIFLRICFLKKRLYVLNVYNVN